MPRKRVYSTRLLSKYLLDHNIGAMDLVRIAGIAVSTAYKIKKGQDIFDLDVFLSVYEGLRRAGYTITWSEISDLF